MKNKKIILSSLLAISVAGSIIAGSTYALFAIKSDANIAVNSGNVDVIAEIGEQTLSHVMPNQDNTEYETITGSLYNGTASINGNKIIIDKMVPGDTISFPISIYNNSNIDVKYNTVIGLTSGEELFDNLEVTINEETFDGLTVKSAWKSAPGVTTKTLIDTVNVSISFPIESDSTAMNSSAELFVTVNAIQGNAIVRDNEAKTVEIYTARDLRTWAKSVNDNTDYKGYTIKLMNDIDLNNENWQPIIALANMENSVLDGNGHTISNMYSNIHTVTSGRFVYGYGFIGNCKTSMSIKNITFDNAEVSAPIGNIVGIVMGYAYSTTLFENVSVINSRIHGYGKVGPILGSGQEPGLQITFKNCNSSNNVIEGAYDIGGLAGMIMRKNGVDNTIIENCTVSDNTLVKSKDSNVISYGEFTNQTLVFRNDDVNEASGTFEVVISAPYSRLQTSGYYFLLYSEYYCSYGSSKYDPSIEGIEGYGWANSSFPINSKTYGMYFQNK